MKYFGYILTEKFLWIFFFFKFLLTWICALTTNLRKKARTKNTTATTSHTSKYYRGSDDNELDEESFGSLDKQETEQQEILSFT